MPFSVNIGGIGVFGGRSGSAPSPFDAANGPRLAGPQGSHPLHSVRADELVRATDGPIGGEITLDEPARVGDGTTGTVHLAATGQVVARSAALRLVGLRLDEVTRSEDHRDSDGHVTSSEHWVEVHGTLFSEDVFLEPAVPATLEAGATWEARFAVPAPPLGPPTAHLGESIIAWALEVRWDVPHGHDHFVAAHVPVAPAGQKGRVELHRRTNAPNGAEGIIASAPIDPATLAGSVEVRLLVPGGSAPSFDGAGLEIDYVIRVLVDRRFRTDAAIERPVGIV